MKQKLSKFLMIPLALMCILTFALLPKIIAAPATPRLYVTPERNIFGTDTTAVGAEFRINISTSDWEAPGLFSFQFELHFDPALLTVVNADYPPDLFLPAPNFPVPVDTTTFEKGYVLFGVTKLGVVPGSTGSGGLGYINFKIKTAPPTAGSVSCDLSITNIILLNPEGGGIEKYDVVNGYYEFSPPKAPVYLIVVPEMIGASEAGTIIRVDIAMKDLTSALKLMLVQWKLRFSPEKSELEYINATEGDFLKNYAQHANEVDPQGGYETAFVAVHDDGADFVFSFTLYSKTPYPATVFPEGSGTLATLTFNATEMPPELTRTDLILFDIMMLDIDGNEIAYSNPVKGTYVAPVVPGDLNIDLKVNIQDVYIFGKAFGSYPGHTRWDSRADLNGDGKVNIIDGIKIAKAFHTS